ncbi:hypothetical protein GPJ56_003389 [Histomonas meleagridis]|uniref:uncharacterized protein n=1 Tax=Histomonas meleagridis TaxID=135588 RepID=UPI0035594571|nr:hypothetical protein GPJ56_003389 [Histomonas meleagridis]KAH0805008.1 hypothetical protein GO595_001953 [Histomonas meleagridis]
MNIFWVLALAITLLCLSLLILIFISFLVPRIGINIANKIAQIVYRFKIQIMVTSCVFILLFAQELSVCRMTSKKRNNDHSQGDVFFFEASQLFKAQRNLYIVVFGITVQFGLLIVSWQINSWVKRNNGLREKKN